MQKILVFGFDGAAPELLFGDERLENVQRLMQLGCYGRLGSSVRIDEAILNQISNQAKNAILVPDKSLYVENDRARDFQSLKALVYQESREQFTHLRQSIQTMFWDYAQIIETGLERLERASGADHPSLNVISDYYLYLDQELGKVLELLSDDTVILILSTRSVKRVDENVKAGPGSFILAASNNPLYGEIHKVNLIDVAPTVLELAGYPIPSTMQGRSLVSGMELVSPGYTVDDEEIIRERLEGLGYI